MNLFLWSALFAGTSGPGPIHDAITVAVQAVGTSRSWTHTNGGGVPTNGTLLAWFFVDKDEDIATAITYNSIAPTQIIKAFNNAPVNGWRYLCRWSSPASGAHTVSISTSASVAIAGISWSFTAAAQGDLSVVQVGSSSGSTNFVVSTDTIINNCLVGMFAANSVGAPSGVGSGNTARDLTERLASATQITSIVNTPSQVYPAFTIGTSAGWIALAFALAPYVAPGGGTAAPASSYYARRRRL